MDPATTAAITKAAAPALGKVFEAAGKSLLAHMGDKAKSIVDKGLVALRIGFEEHLNSSYEKCRIIKTIINHDKPIDLMNSYTNLYLENSDGIIEDNSLIDDLEKYKTVVITGLAGCGKSMFMRYLTISRLINPRYSIPLFVELRDINNNENLLSYIFKNCASAGSKLTINQFELALQSGAIMLVLDGFDEVDQDNKTYVENEIFSIKNKFPKSPIIVSSRPDERFSSWISFYVFNVRKLNKEQIFDLIGKIEYDPGIKSRFLSQVETNLIETHESFLSSPLLATIMLLTFEQYAKIPDKIHAFFKMAFETLCYRHDALKLQFTRRIQCGLTHDELAKCFAAFCAFSYFEEKFSFKHQTMIDLIGRASSYVNIDVNPKLYAIDLIDSLCMLQKDGNEIAFVHRSFQEYFTAIFASSYHGLDSRNMFNILSQRTTDNVTSMVFDMAQEKCERDWILPTIQDIIRDLSICITAADKVLIFGQTLGLIINQDSRFMTIWDDKKIGYRSFLNTLSSLYEDHEISIAYFFYSLKTSDLIKAIEKTGFYKNRRFKPLLKILQREDQTTGDTNICTVRMNQNDSPWIEEMGIDKKVDFIYKEMRKMENSITKILSE